MPESMQSVFAKIFDEPNSAIRVSGGTDTEHRNDTSAAHAASAVSNAPAGNIAATTVQAAIDELDSEKGGKATANTWSADQTYSSAKIIGPTAIRMGAAALTAATGLNLVEGTTAADGIAFGTDVALYRSAADTLTTPDQFRAYQLISDAVGAGGLSNNAVAAFHRSGTVKALFGVPTAASGLITTSVADTDFCLRTAGGRMLFSTDAGTTVHGILDAGSLQKLTNIRLGAAAATAATGLNLVGGTTSADGIAAGTDTNLYRSAADTWATDDSLKFTATGSRIIFGHSGQEQTTVGAAGGASALPATPTKYFKVVDSAGTTLIIPAYAAA